MRSRSRTARGFSGDLILDEFAFHEDSAAIWDAAEPILSSNPDFLCRVASTGNGTGNMFYRMATEGQFKLSKVRRSDAWRMGVKIYDAKTCQPITPDEARAQSLDKASYDQNYECAFASETGALLTWELINRATDNAAPIFDIDESGAPRTSPPTVVGADLRADRSSDADAIGTAIGQILDRAAADGLMVYGGGDVACTHDDAVYPFAADGRKRDTAPVKELMATDLCASPTRAARSCAKTCASRRGSARRRAASQSPQTTRSRHGASASRIWYN